MGKLKFAAANKSFGGAKNSDHRLCVCIYSSFYLLGIKTDTCGAEPTSV